MPERIINKPCLMSYNDLMATVGNHRLCLVDRTQGDTDIWAGMDDGEYMTVIVYNPDDAGNTEASLHELFDLPNAGVEHVSLNAQTIY